MRQGSMLHSGEKYFSVTSAKVISLLIHQEDDSDIATTNLPEQLVTESAQSSPNSWQVFLEEYHSTHLGHPQCFYNQLSRLTRSGKTSPWTLSFITYIQQLHCYHGRYRSFLKDMAFWDVIYLLYGLKWGFHNNGLQFPWLSCSIISDCNPIFLSSFWQT